MKNGIRFTNKCGISECQLLKALYQTFNSDLLTVYVGVDRSAYIVEYDGITVTQWLIKDAQEFINRDIYDRIDLCEIVTII